MQDIEHNKIEQQKKHFETVSHRYYSGRQSKNHLLLKDLMWGFFLRDKPYLKMENMNVLEPMCGYAEGRTILERHLGIRVNYEGFDYSDTFVEMVKRLSPSTNITRQDVAKFVPSQKYDLIILIGGLHHVFDISGEVVKKIASSLKEGGFFINLEPTHNNSITEWISDAIYKRNPLFDYNTERRFGLKELNDIYTYNGFEIVDQLYPGLFSYIFFYNPDAFPCLDLGQGGLTRSLFKIDKLFFRNFIGRKLSFATLTILQKVKHDEKK